MIFNSIYNDNNTTNKITNNINKITTIQLYYNQ